jgi:uncharacterized NAD(P)/FAD-binding protein YdhS
VRTIAIVGAGFSGTMLAVHLLRQQEAAAPSCKIVLIERSGRFGPGLAYGTTSPSHLLNVPAGRMSALPQDPDHFLRWARLRDPLTSGGTFVARSIYGQYLQDLLAQAEASAPGQFERIVGEAVGLQPIGDGVTITLADGRSVIAHEVVLATGNTPPADPPIVREQLRASRRYAKDPWAPGVLAAIPPDDRVVIIGTGLTMQDVVLDLTQRGHRGAIHAFSRRGLLPQPHRANPKPAKYDPPAGVEHWPCTARGLLRAVRREVAAAAKRHVDWREVITSLRPVTAKLWQGLSPVEQARFLRHVRPFWEVARHRAAPQADGAIQALMLSGRLTIHSARLVAASETASELALTLQPRERHAPVELHADRLINCTGPESDPANADDPLLSQLLSAGLIRRDALGQGIEIDEHDQPRTRDGGVTPWLWIIGPMTKGRYWESTAVPELRAQAQTLAGRLLMAATVQ